MALECDALDETKSKLGRPRLAGDPKLVPRYDVLPNKSVLHGRRRAESPKGESQQSKRVPRPRQPLSAAAAAVAAALDLGGGDTVAVGQADGPYEGHILICVRCAGSRSVGQSVACPGCAAAVHGTGRRHRGDGSVAPGGHIVAPNQCELVPKMPQGDQM